MNSLSQDSLLMALKIAIVPVMLLSILWRNRREKRRRAQALTKERAERGAVRREVVDLGSADIGALRAALEKAETGADLVSSRGEKLTARRLRRELARAQMDAGLFDDAARILTADEAEGDVPMLLCLARLRVHQGQDEAARRALSDVADLGVAEARTASRGLRAHLAELLALSLTDQTGPLSLRGSDLSALGALECLVLSGRWDEARALTDEMLSVLDRALAESERDPEGRGGGLPRAALVASRSALTGFRVRLAETDPV